jgi:hypothetical protein
LISSPLGLASPTINNAPINFGAVRIGSTVANQAISVSNTAPIATTTELLDGSVVSAPTGFTGSGSFTGLAAGAPPNTSIQVGMNTSRAGAHSGNVVLNFVSDGTSIPGDGTTTNLGNTNVAVSGAVYRLANGGSSNALQVGLDTSKAGVFGGSAALSLASHDSDLPDLALTVSPVALTAQVNNYAVAGFGKTSGSGSLGAVGTDYVLDFGAVKKGSAVVMSTVFAGNLASGPSDLLDGSFSIASGGGDFGLSGFNPFSGLDAGQETAPLGVTFDTSSLGFVRPSEAQTK